MPVISTLLLNYSTIFIAVPKIPLIKKITNIFSLGLNYTTIEQKWCLILNLFTYTHLRIFQRFKIWINILKIAHILLSIMNWQTHFLIYIVWNNFKFKPIPEWPKGYRGPLRNSTEAFWIKILSKIIYKIQKEFINIEKDRFLINLTSYDLFPRRLLFYSFLVRGSSLSLEFPFFFSFCTPVLVRGSS